MREKQSSWIKLRLSGRQDYREMVVKTVKDLQFYPTGDVISQPATVSWMQAENMRCLGQRQRTLLLMALQTT